MSQLDLDEVSFVGPFPIQWSSTCVPALALAAAALLSPAQESMSQQDLLGSPAIKGKALNR